MPLLEYVCVSVNSATTSTNRKLLPLQNRIIKMIICMNGYVRIAEMHDLHGQLCIKLVEYSHYEEHVNPEVELHTRPNVNK